MSLATASMAALAVGAGHGGAHYLFGDSDSFGDAAVQEAGIVVLGVTFVSVLVLTGGI